MKQIVTLGELLKASQDRKAVYVPSSSSWKKPKPAAFIIGLPGRMLVRLFQQGMFIYGGKVA